MRARILALLRSRRGPLALAGAALALAAMFLAFALRDRPLSLRITAGDARGRRAEIARALVDEARARGLTLTLVDVPGSEEAMERVQRRELDAALVQGGLEPGPDVREVAPLVLEPLHLLVSPDADVYALEDLRSARVQLGPPRSGTRRLALELLALAGLEQGDVDEVAYTYAELEALEEDELPDALFTISALPSPIATFLVARRGYSLLRLPYAGAIEARDVAVQPGLIPAFLYGSAPPMPTEDVPTLATRMIAIAHRDADPEAVRRLVESLRAEHFLRAANLVPPADGLLDRPELPLHRGTLAWLDRDQPVLTSDFLQGVESLRSFLVSLAVAGVLFWRWARQRRLHGLDAYLSEVLRIEVEALELERTESPDIARLVALRARLGDAKSRALESYARGEVHSEELLSAFLTHVSDARSHLNAMILHERTRLDRGRR